MSRIDELIAELCPDGVEYKALGDVAEYVTKRVSGESITTANYTGVENLLQNTAGRADASSVPQYSGLIEYRVGDVLIGNIRPYLKKAWLADRDGGTNGDVLTVRIDQSYRDRLLPRFLYFLLSSDSFFAFNMQHARGAKMPRGDKAAILRYAIPLPPLEVQREIVRMLDLFTTLEAELEAELEARRRQYAHYRDSLLTFPDGVPWVPMGEIVHAIASGRNKSRSKEGAYPVYGSTGLIGHTEEPAYSGDALLVARVGANAGLVNAVHGNFDVSDNTLVVRPGSAWNVRFAYHQLVHVNLNQYAVGGGQPLVTGKLLKDIQVPVPRLQEQVRIAAILDAFDALVNDLSIGLPAELAARRKQYEYYRERLLTFKEAAA